MLAHVREPGSVPEPQEPPKRRGRPPKPENEIGVRAKQKRAAKARGNKSVQNELISSAKTEPVKTRTLAETGG